MSQIATGSASRFRYFTETTLGVFPTGEDFYEPSFISESIGANIGTINSSEITADRSAPAARGGNIGVGGSLTTDFGLNRFGVLLGHLFGKAPVTTNVVPAAAADTTVYARGAVVSQGVNDYLCVVGGESGDVSTDLVGTTENLVITSGDAQFIFFGTTATAKKQHVFKGDAELLDNGISIEKAIIGGASDVFLRASGGRVNSLAITIPQEGIIQAVWDLLFTTALSPHNATDAGTPVVQAEDGPTGYQTHISIDGTDSFVVQNGNFTLSNELNADNFVVGARTRHSITAQRRKITGALNLLMENSDQLNRFLNEEAFPLVITFTQGIGYASFRFPRVRLFGNGVPAIGGPGRIEQAFSFEAMTDGTTDVELTLKNTVAAYTV